VVACVRVREIVFVGLVACGTSPPQPQVSPSGAPSESPKPANSVTSAPTPSSAPTEKAPPAASDIFANLKSDVTACYAKGKKAVPSMNDGKVTLHAAVDPQGKTTCVVPSDDTGLTQDTETCMRERLEKQSYPRSGGQWSALLPIVVKDSVVALGEPRTKADVFETIESQGLAEDVYDVIDTLLPSLYACVRGVEHAREMRLIYVGGKVAADGHMTCALASSPSASIAPEVRECTAKVLLGAKFRAPKKGWGLVSVPLNVVGGT